MSNNSQEAASDTGAQGPSTGRLQHDRVDAENFISALAGHRDTPVTFQTFLDDRKGHSPSPPQVLHGTLEEHWEALVELNCAGHGIYVTVNECDGKGREGRNVVSLRALFTDDDGGGRTPTGLPPSITVASRRGPHHYWLLKPGEPLSRFTAAQKQLSTTASVVTRTSGGSACLVWLRRLRLVTTGTTGQPRGDDTGDGETEGNEGVREVPLRPRARANRLDAPIWARGKNAALAQPR